MFEFLKKRREREKKNSKKNSKTHTRRSLVVTTAEDTSTLERLLSSRRRSKENFTVLLRADDRVKMHSQTLNDIRNQFSKDQIQRAVDKELLQAFEIKNVMHFSPANFLFCSFFLFLHKCPQKKHTRERRNTRRTTHRKTLLFLSLRNTINTHHAQKHTEERKLERTTRAFFFSSLSSFQRESCIHIPLSALKKKRERSSLKIHLSEKREFEILNIFAFARERENCALISSP